MIIILIQEQGEIVNDHFGSGDAQSQSTNDEAELQEQRRADDVDEEERDDPPDWEKMKVAFISNSLKICWQKFYRNVALVVLYRIYAFSPKRWIWLVG